LADHDGKVQLHRALNLGLFSCGDVFADGLRVAFHGLGSDLQTGQELQLAASVIERGLLAHRRLHAAHAWGELGVLDIQFDVGGELPGVAVRAQVVGARHFGLTHGGEHRLGA
jgi:hypothetical protein